MNREVNLLRIESAICNAYPRLWRSAIGSIANDMYRCREELSSLVPDVFGAGLQTVVQLAVRRFIIEIEGGSEIRYSDLESFLESNEEMMWRMVFVELNMKDPSKRINCYTPIPYEEFESANGVKGPFVLLKWNGDYELIQCSEAQSCLVDIEGCLEHVISLEDKYGNLIFEGSVDGYGHHWGLRRAI